MECHSTIRALKWKRSRISPEQTVFETPKLAPVLSMVFQVFLQDAAPQLHAEPLGNTLQLMGHVREIATSRELLVLQLFKQAYM